MKRTFKFQKLASDIFGSIYRPYAEVLVLGRNNRPRRISMLVDTGADYTLLPRREAALLGIDLKPRLHSTYHLWRGWPSNSLSLPGSTS